MRKEIIELSVKDAIHDLVSSDTPNRFVNNGKRSIYRKSDSISTPCGKGYDKCTDGCCTKEGVCLPYKYYPWKKCLVENGCQSEFDKCSSKTDVIKECEKEYDDNKECFISISSNSDDSTIMDQCKILESNKCKEYFKKRINNLSYCTIAKDYKSFSSIYNKFNEKWYHNTVKECRQRMDEYIDQCNTEMNTDNLKDCFISDNINFNDPYNFASTASFCNNLKQQKCISLYDENGDSMKKYLPTCHLLLQHYNKNVVKDKTGKNVFNKDTYKLYKNYLNFCENAQERSIELCNDLIDDHKECEINVNDDDINCKTFKSGKCQDFYNLLNRGSFVCNEAKKYVSYDMINNFKSEKYSKYQEKCEMTTLNSNAKRRWIYNASVNKCLFAPSRINYKPILKPCNDSNESQWYFNSFPRGIIHSAVNTNLCLNLTDISIGRVEYTKCNNDIIPFKYTNDGTIYSAKYGNGKCLSAGDGKSSDTDIMIFYRSCKKTKDQIWELWDKNPSDFYNTEGKTQIVWLYNRKLNKCVHTGKNYNDRPHFNGCWDSKAAMWEIPLSGDGFYKNVQNGLCMRVNDANNGEVLMGKCDGNAIIKDINSSYNRESIIFSADKTKCLDTDNPSDLNSFILKFNPCNKQHYQQHYEIRTTLPSKEVKCGNGIGNCPSGQCCSKDGVCGTMDDHCGTGCQSSYGRCFSSISTSISSNDESKWIYNASADKCLYFKGSSIYDRKVFLKDCEDNKRFKWYYSPHPKGYIHSAAETDYCLNINYNQNQMAMNDCDSSSAFEYANEGIIYSLDIGNNKCMGVGSNHDDTSFEKCIQSDDQKWTLWNRNPYEITKKETRTVWIYNKELKKCLISGSSFTYRPVIGDCSNNKNSKWIIPISGDGLFKSMDNGYCMNVANINRGTTVMRECDSNAVIKDISTSYNKESIMSTNTNKCLGLLDSSKIKLNMNVCDKSKKDQHWEIRTTLPK
eukprot:jgi/Orpsp1_1/1191412/evm.model.d7180000085589.1